MTFSDSGSAKMGTWVEEGIVELVLDVCEANSRTVLVVDGPLACTSEMNSVELGDTAKSEEDGCTSWTPTADVSR
jgi:hypothetical protein